MKEQIAVICRYTVLQETEKIRQILQRPTLKHGFYENIKRSISFVDTTSWQKMCF